MHFIEFKVLDNIMFCILYQIFFPNLCTITLLRDVHKYQGQNFGYFGQQCPGGRIEAQGQVF